MISPRYLTTFGYRDTLHQFTDILVIGAGIAGLRAALEVPPELRVLVVTKGQVAESNSRYAQGGIAGVLAPDDRFEDHVTDTLTAGVGLCDPEIVDVVVREAPEQISYLIQLGTNFDREAGELALTREGGHSHRRIVHALGDATGHEMMRAIITEARTRPNVSIWENTFTIDLLTVEGRCVGALVWQPGVGPLLLWAKQVILASGGAGMIYRETTNPPVATGDGMAMAWRAGADLQDMEFMQFHPTVLYVAGSDRFLISEAVRGEGAYLRDVNGKRFMTEEDSRAELAPRDVVSLAIIRAMERTEHPNVYLDLSHLSAEKVHTRFPGISRVLRSFGLDLATDRIPVRPAAHYMIGGITTDAHGRTTIPNLWAAGEVTSTGLHGANRLASNSLLEGLVFGARCGRAATDSAAQMPQALTAWPIDHTVPPVDPPPQLDVLDVTNSLRSLMVRKMGIIRNERRFAQAREQIDFWCGYVLVHEFDGPSGWELQNLLTLAQVMIETASRRRESRGTHYRDDYPERDDEHWAIHLTAASRTSSERISEQRHAGSNKSTSIRI